MRRRRKSFRKRRSSHKRSKRASKRLNSYRTSRGGIRL